jgi:hypothetical protein
MTGTMRGFAASDMNFVVLDDRLASAGGSWSRLADVYKKDTGSGFAKSRCASAR